jgi:adenylylsulfate kinase-like enzyme
MVFVCADIIKRFIEVHILSDIPKNDRRDLNYLFRKMRAAVIRYSAFLL